MSKDELEKSITNVREVYQEHNSWCFCYHFCKSRDIIQGMGKKKTASDNGSFFKVKLWVFNFHLMKWISIGKNAAEGDD